MATGATLKTTGNQYVGRLAGSGVVDGDVTAGALVAEVGADPLTVTGTFTIAAGETATVHAVTIHDPETGKDRFVTPGLYGAADTTAKGAHGVDWIQGTGLLNVAASFEKGTIFLVR